MQASTPLVLVAHGSPSKGSAEIERLFSAIRFDWEESAMATAGMDSTTVDHLLTTTRTVRKRLDLSRPVDRAVILECLRLAVQAPTGSNRQGWRWIVVTDRGKRAAIADIYRRAIRPYLEFGKAALDPANEQM